MVKCILSKWTSWCGEFWVVFMVFRKNLYLGSMGGTLWCMGYVAMHFMCKWKHFSMWWCVLLYLQNKKSPVRSLVMTPLEKFRYRSWSWTFLVTIMTIMKTKINVTQKRQIEELEAPFFPTEFLKIQRACKIFPLWKQNLYICSPVSCIRKIVGVYCFRNDNGEKEMFDNP